MVCCVLDGYYYPLNIECLVLLCRRICKQIANRISRTIGLIQVVFCRKEAKHPSASTESTLDVDVVANSA